MTGPSTLTPARRAGRLVAAVLAAGLPLHAPAQQAAAPDPHAEWPGERIMQESQRRHEQFPYVYEEQTMVLTDASGNRDVRQCRRFSRVEEDGSFKLLLVFDQPEAIRGVALLAVRRADGQVDQGVYLPAFGAEFKRPAGEARGGHFLGTDFAVADLAPDPPREFRYVRGEDRVLEGEPHFVIDAYPANAEVERNTGYGLRRHLVRMDNFVIVQTDFFDRRLRFAKRLTRHDLRQVNALSWRANMIVVNDERDGHRTLLKVDRRVYSRDYVPSEIFDPAFLLANGHLHSLADRVAGHATPAGRDIADGS